ncbi:hypothetical protein EI94DRAFT_1716701 [Lactarius quietus]|nr:hypothetical protein EI94DRAFT_1716701 [Lactarius quietus]
MSIVLSGYEPTPPKIRSTPTNFLLVSKNGVAIQGQYFLDLSIPPAPQFVSDAVSGTENLSLYTTNGAITADVWATGNNKSKRVSMKLCSDNGNIRAKVYDVFCNGESEHRLSLNIELRANYGDVSLSLPRHFRGPITIRTSHERIAFSPALEKHMAPVSDVQGVRVYFVGDRPRSGRWRGNDDDDEESEEDTSAGGPPEEPLDELSVGGSHTGVRIQCHGEPELPPMPQNGWENFCMGTVRFFKSGRIS